MVEVLEQIPQKSVPQHSAKSTKRAPKSAFADFINNLGKTTSAKNSAESQGGLPRSPALARNDEVLDSAPKDKILSNILKGKNEEILQNSAPSPLESILSRPRATQVKFNQTPQIVDSAENNNLQNLQDLQGRLPRSPTLARNEGLLDSSPTAQNDKVGGMAHNDKIEIQNDKMGKIAENDKVEKSLDSAIQNDKASNLAKNSAKENIAESRLDSAENNDLRGNSQNLQDLQGRLPRSPTLARNEGLLDSSPSAQNDKMGGMAENGKVLDVDSAILANQNNSSLRENPQDFRGNPPLENSAESQGGLPRSPTLARNDETTEKNADSPMLARNDEFAPKLGIKNTLKYGAFKAFDALSLLKPSDGKKLSELIKKADELSLNLQSVKYAKMGENKENLGLDSADSQNLDKNNLRVVKNAESRLDSALKQEIKLDSANNENMPKKDEKSAETNNIEVKNETKKETPQIKNNDLKSAESKTTEPKITDSKSAESPLKSALETENNDLKPINFKNIAESKKETSLDSAKDSAKDAIKETKDAGKQTQENAPFANTQGTSKIANQIFDARETMRHFAYALKQEIQNHKPPLSKITIELQPAHLGSVEVSITSQGKNIQIQLNAPQNTLNLFIQNQSDLRTALTQAGYENVAMSFSNGAQMGFSDNSGKWRYESAQKSRNTFSLNESDENDEVFEIMITNNYA